jgi:cytochrome c oxidase subunit 3
MYAILRFKNPEVFEYASHYLDTIMGGVNTCVLILSSLTMAMAVYFAQRGMKWPLVTCLFLTFLGAVGFLVIKYFEYTHKFHENLVWGASFYQPVDEEERVLVTTPHQAPATLAEQSTAPDLSPGAASAALVKLPAADASVVKKAAFGPGGLAPASGSPEQESEVKAEAAAEAKLPHLRDPKMPVNTHQFFAIYYCMTGLHGIHVVIGMGMIAWLMWGAMLGRYDGNYYTPVDLGGLYWHIVDLIWIFLFPLFYLIH